MNCAHKAPQSPIKLLIQRLRFSGESRWNLHVERGPNIAITLASVVAKLSKQFKPGTHPRPRKENLSFFFEMKLFHRIFTTYKIKWVIKSSKLYKSPSRDGNFLQKSFGKILTVLVKFLKSSFVLRHISKLWAQVRVVFLAKAGNELPHGLNSIASVRCLNRWRNWWTYTLEVELLHKAHFTANNLLINRENPQYLLYVIWSIHFLINCYVPIHWHGEYFWT